MTWKTLLSRLTKGCPAPYRTLVRAHGKSRKAAVNFICDIGGYSDRRTSYAVGFNAKAYGCNLDMKTMFGHAARDECTELYSTLTNDGERGLLYNLFAEHLKANEKTLWERATEDAWESFEQDEGTFWGEDRDAKFHLVGRSGGHLVLAECGLINLCMSPEALKENLLERESESIASSYEVSDSEVAHLFLLCVQLTVDWPRDAIDREVEYRAAWLLWSSFDENDFKNILSMYRNPDRFLSMTREHIMAAVSEDAHPVVSTICVMAGIGPLEE